MTNRIKVSNLQGLCSDLLRAMDIVGLTDVIGAPGEYTCFKRQGSCDLNIGILPGNFTAAEIEELFRAAAFGSPSSVVQPRLAA